MKRLTILGSTGSIGVNYNISPDLTAGVAVRLTRTEQPGALQLVFDAQHLSVS